jgi:hypothetical protein
MIFRELDAVTATSFSLANKEFEAIFKELAPKVFGNEYRFPLDIDTVVACKDKSHISLKAVLMHWVPAGLYWDPFTVKFVGLETLRSTCDAIMEDAEDDKGQRKEQRRGEKEMRQNARAERKAMKKRQRDDDLEIWMNQQIENASDSNLVPNEADFVPDRQYSSDEDTESGRDSESEVGVGSETEDELGLSGSIGPDKSAMFQRRIGRP